MSDSAEAAATVVEVDSVSNRQTWPEAAGAAEGKRGGYNLSLGGVPVFVDCSFYISKLF